VSYLFSIFWSTEERLRPGTEVLWNFSPFGEECQNPGVCVWGGEITDPCLGLVLPLFDYGDLIWGDNTMVIFVIANQREIITSVMFV